MTIKLDKSPESVVVYCTECPHWQAFAWTVLEAHEIALRHERGVHPESYVAQNARDRWRARHAVEAGNVLTPSDTFSRGIHTAGSGSDRVHPDHETGRREPRSRIALVG